MKSTCLDMDRWARNTCMCFKHVHETWLKINYLPWVWCRSVFTVQSVVESVRRVLFLSLEFSLVSSLLWKWVYIDYSRTSMLVEAKCCTPSAAFCPFRVSRWRLWCLLLLLCCDMGRWHKFMDEVCAWPCSKWPSGFFFHIERFWCCLGQLVVFTDSLWI